MKRNRQIWIGGVALICFLISEASDAAKSTKFDAAMKAAGEKLTTQGGNDYVTQKLIQPLGQAVNGVLESCGKGDRELACDVVFYIRADGTVTNLMASTTPFGKCVLANFRLPERLPSPPGDLWPIGARVVYRPDKSKKIEDQPVQRTAESFGAFDKATAALTAKARATYPDAKKKFLGGLPPGYIFYVRVRLKDPDGKIEDVFAKVEGFDALIINTTIASDLGMVTTYKKGQAYKIKENDILDWTIERADGSEEGNLIGKYMDAHPEQR